jgi:hypothetical protein
MDSLFEDAPNEQGEEDYDEVLRREEIHPQGSFTIAEYANQKAAWWLLDSLVPESKRIDDARRRWDLQQQLMEMWATISTDQLFDAEGTWDRFEVRVCVEKETLNGIEEYLRR